jgi:hypothetical protein
MQPLDQLALMIALKDFYGCTVALGHVLEALVDALQALGSVNLGFASA